MKITIGLAAFADSKSDSDAIVVRALRKAGAIVYCKTTMPQTGMVTISSQISEQKLIDI
jgi:Asp-tRNA(Asn)/Glu-tRNA(Gln) amidotransferase A subunit family amidase